LGAIFFGLMRLADDDYNFVWMVVRMASGCRVGNALAETCVIARCCLTTFLHNVIVSSIGFVTNSDSLDKGFQYFFKQALPTTVRDFKTR
jgi:hypothetical protein